ncbi:MAG: dTMP kinase [Planctomycetota bacterium]
MVSPAFIAFEGVDGSGKSTQIELLRQRLRNDGCEPLVVREPGGTALGEEVRNILLHREEIALHVDTEALLFLASRVQLFEEKIRPTLAADEWVISDRFYLSTLVYQGWAAGRDVDALRRLISVVLGERRPRLFVVIDTPWEICQQRVGDSPDRFEGRQGFLEKVADGFRSCAALDGDTVIHIDGEGSADDVAVRVWEGVCSALS